MSAYIAKPPGLWAGKEIIRRGQRRTIRCLNALSAQANNDFAASNLWRDTRLPIWQSVLLFRNQAPRALAHDVTMQSRKQIHH